MCVREKKSRNGTFVRSSFVPSCVDLNRLLLVFSFGLHLLLFPMGYAFDGADARGHSLPSCTSLTHCCGIFVSRLLSHLMNLVNLFHQFSRIHTQARGHTHLDSVISPFLLPSVCEIIALFSCSIQSWITGDRSLNHCFQTECLLPSVFRWIIFIQIESFTISNMNQWPYEWMNDRSMRILNNHILDGKLHWHLSQAKQSAFVFDSCSWHWMAFASQTDDPLA